MLKPMTAALKRNLGRTHHRFLCECHEFLSSLGGVFTTRDAIESWVQLTGPTLITEYNAGKHVRLGIDGTQSSVSGFLTHMQEKDTSSSGVGELPMLPVRQ